MKTYLYFQPEYFREFVCDSSKCGGKYFIARDNPDEMIYPQPLLTSGKDAVEVGRIRKDFSIEHGLNLWVCGDQIRKGAALNALQIAERMISDGVIQ